jgi:hypothetical protein
MGPNVLANGQSKSGYQLFVKGVRTSALKQNLIAEPKPPSHVGFAPSNQETKMKFALIGATAVAAAAFATPVLAQAVISDPGKCAQYYPDANCQNLGPGNPYTDGGYYRDDNWQNGNAMMPRHAWHHPHRHHTAK